MFYSDEVGTRPCRETPLRQGEDVFDGNRSISVPMTFNGRSKKGVEKGVYGKPLIE
jgi:hypothetical protein